MNETRTNESELAGANLMKQLFSDIVSSVYRKKGGRWDLKLVRQEVQLPIVSSIAEELANLPEFAHLHPPSSTSESMQTE